MQEIPSQSILAFFGLAFARLVLDSIGFPQLWLVDDVSNPPYPPSFYA